MFWEFFDSATRIQKRIQTDLSVSPLLSQCLLHLGITDSDAAKDFLSPKLSNLLPAHSISGIPEIARDLCHFRGKLLVYGDYDVDGLTASSQTRLLLEALGVVCHTFIPNRFKHGYGITSMGLKDALGNHSPDGFLALDCGTNSVSLIRQHIPKTTPVWIIDHHQVDGLLPLRTDPNTTIVNPHASREVPSVMNLCTAGLVFKLAQAVCACLQQSGDPRLNRIDLGIFLEFATLGTVADLVTLRDENRRIVAAGLRRLNRSRHPGIKALREVAGLRPEDPLDTEDLAFRIAPRINAGGRLGEAELPLSLLTNTSPARASEIAVRLDQLNRERQRIERACSASAEPQVRKLIDSGASGLIAWDDDWHHGIVGIVAGRFTNQHHRPTLILGREGTTFKGSGRAPEGVDLVEILRRCRVQPDQWGGHPAAIGLTVDADRMKDFADAFLLAADAHCAGAPPEPRLQLTARLTPSGLDLSVLDDLERLKPFGKGNPEPIFALFLPEGLADLRPFGNGHLRARIPGLRHVSHSVVAWGGNLNPPPESRPIDCAVRLKRNRWRGREDLRLELIDWKQRTGSPSKSR